MKRLITMLVVAAFMASGLAGCKTIRTTAKELDRSAKRDWKTLDKEAKKGARELKDK